MRETFDSCHEVARANGRPLVKPASLRKPRSRAPSACRASSTCVVTGRTGLVLGVGDGGGPQQVPQAHALGYGCRILDDLRSEHSALGVEVAHGEKAVVVQPPVVASQGEGDALRHAVPGQPADLFACLLVEGGGGVLPLDVGSVRFRDHADASDGSPFPGDAPHELRPRFHVGVVDDLTAQPARERAVLVGDGVVVPQLQMECVLREALKELVALGAGDQLHAVPPVGR